MDSIIIFCAKYLVVGVLVTLIIASFKLSKNLAKRFAATAFISGLLAIIIDKLAGLLYYDPRPFVSQHIVPLIPHGADNGFPSEHTVFAMTLSSVIYLYNKKLGILSFAITLAIGIGRVLAHVHSPIDIIGGLVIGAAAASLGYRLTQKFMPLPKHTAAERPTPRT